MTGGGDKADERWRLPLGGDNAYLFEMFERFRRDPDSVPDDWRRFFSDCSAEPSDSEGRELGESTGVDLARITAAFRARGHLGADLDPLGLRVRQDPIALDPELTPGAVAGPDHGAEVERLRRLYCGKLAIELDHIHDSERRAWIAQAFEASQDRDLDALHRVRSALCLAKAHAFEAFMRARFPTKKTFGLSGAETMLWFLERLLETAAEAGVSGVVIGGMHRGRLNMLVNLLGKPPRELFWEIMDAGEPNGPSCNRGDVPYHKGYNGGRQFDGGASLEFNLMPHPSHLLAVAPVTLGYARGLQDRSAADSRQNLLCVLLHTDAAFAGQGLTQELLQLSGLEGYRVDGTIHLVVNNQVGFSTDPQDSRSARYCTDVAKSIEAPILHVNGDDPEAAARAAACAVAYRQAQRGDIVIDLVCYRRLGHNELDEPRFTQPLMYRAIDAKEPIWPRRRRELEADPDIDLAQLDAQTVHYRRDLESAFESPARPQPNRPPSQTQVWASIRTVEEQALDEPLETGVSLARLRQIGAKLCAPPPGFSLDPKVARFLERRLESLEGGHGLTWNTAEALAFGSLLVEGTSVRLSGQDSVRGTFTQRHLALHDQSDGSRILPLAKLASGQAPFEAINAPLAEYATLGFEFGYSLVDPHRLIVWEAQFGDFANAAQIIFDQFIAVSEERWSLMSGLVVLLPHGLEGQGPDHSSARPERFLQLCARGNMLLANCTTPANYFHLLRRQVRAPWRKPLILFTPKSLLRHKAAVSELDELGPGSGFRAVIEDPGEIAARPDEVRRLVLCSGKIFYELTEARAAGSPSDVAIARLEQLYPIPRAALSGLFERYPEAEVVWCQEESRNYGAWPVLRHAIEEILGGLNRRQACLRFVGREAAASPAGGSEREHRDRNREIVAEALR